MWKSWRGFPPRARTGPRRPEGRENRSQGSLLYNKTYGQYDAIFLKEDSEEVYLTLMRGMSSGFPGRYWIP